MKQNNLENVKNLIYSYDKLTFKDNVKERLDKVLQLYLERLTKAFDTVAYDEKAMKEWMKNEK